MFGVFSFSFFSFLHINYKPTKGKKSTLNAKKFYTIALPNYSRSLRCQIPTLSTRPKFAGQMELQKLRIPGKMELRILKLGACGELQILDLGLIWSWELDLGLHSESSKLSIFSFLDLRETGKLCYNYYRKEKEKKTFRGFAQWFSSNR